MNCFRSSVSCRSLTLCVAKGQMMRGAKEGINKPSHPVWCFFKIYWFKWRRQRRQRRQKMRTYDNDDCGRNSASGQIVTQTISLNSRYKCWVPLSEVFQPQCRFPLFPLPSEMSQIKAHRPRVAGAEFPTAGGILPEVLPRWCLHVLIFSCWLGLTSCLSADVVIQTQSKPEVNQMKLIELGWTWYVNYYKLL
jgi:hypothetical protein